MVLIVMIFQTRIQTPSDEPLLYILVHMYVQSHISQTEIILNTYNIEKIPLQNGAQRGARIVIPGIYL